MDDTCLLRSASLGVGSIDRGACNTSLSFQPSQSQPDLVLCGYHYELDHSTWFSSAPQITDYRGYGGEI